jgi:hypothetical protein
MTIEMTLWRRAAACLVAGTGVVLALGWAAPGAQASQLLSSELRSVLEHAAPGAKVISSTVVKWPRQGVTPRGSAASEPRSSDPRHTALRS